MGSVLIVDDLEEYLRALERSLRGDWVVHCARGVEEAKASLGRSDSDVAVIDMRLSEEDAGNRDGLELLRWIREHRAGLPVVMMSAYRDFDAAVHALNLHADAFLTKPIDVRELKRILARLAQGGAGGA